MTVSYKAAEIEQLAVSPGATIYTAPTNTTSQVVYALCTNASASAATFSIHIVQSGGSLAATNLYVDAKPIAIDGSDNVPEVVGVVLNAGDFIIAFGSAATAMNLKLGVKEIV
jgi:hypothetical protein